MSAYVIIEVTPSDAEKFSEYERLAVPIAAKFGGEPIGRDADPLPIEREDKPAYGVILKFPSKQAASDYFESPEYAPVRAFRQSFAKASALVIEV